MKLLQGAKNQTWCYRHHEEENWKGEFRSDPRVGSPEHEKSLRAALHLEAGPIPL
jgi:hypothetical protein